MSDKGGFGPAAWQGPQGGFSVDPGEVVRLADEVGLLPKEALTIRQDLSATLERLPPAAFGLVAESNDAYMAYRRRVGAANTGWEAADLELQQMSEDIGRSATSYSWQDREVAEDYARLSKKLTSGGTAASTPKAP